MTKNQGNKKKNILISGDEIYAGSTTKLEDKAKNHDNIIALCKNHHEFMHNGLIENEISPKQLWKVNIYKQTDEIDERYRQYRSR